MCKRPWSLMLLFQKKLAFQKSDYQFFFVLEGQEVEKMPGGGPGQC